MQDIIATGKFCFYTSIFLLFFLFLYLHSALLINTHDIDIYVESGTSSLLLGGSQEFSYYVLNCILTIRFDGSPLQYLFFIPSTTA